MLTLQRIQEAEKNVTIYLRDSLITKTSIIDERAFKILLDNTNESLKVAEYLHNANISNLWIIVSSYYSMYYLTKLLLYKNGYKVGEKISHKVTAEALIVFLRNKIKDNLIEIFENSKEEAMQLAGLRADELIESFDQERGKRERFQYSMTEVAMSAKAQTSLQRAKEFSLELKKLL